MSCLLSAPGRCISLAPESLGGKSDERTSCYQVRCEPYNVVSGPQCESKKHVLGGAEFFKRRLSITFILILSRIVRLRAGIDVNGVD